MNLGWVSTLACFTNGLPRCFRKVQCPRVRPYASLSSKRRVPQKRRKMKVAVVGCAHGEVEAIFKAVEEIEQVQSTKVELIICAGDFQAVRDQSDLACMACPVKFRDMRTFWKYYEGSSIAKTPLIFIGGNHEASNYLQEIPLGGLVAPNMYYLGNAGVINFKGLRIAGVSGVYVEHSYEKPRSEKPPYPRGEIKSVYHARKIDTDRILRIRKPVDIFLSHDWPRGIWDHGDRASLLAAKPFLRSEIEKNIFGHPGTAEIVRQLQPRFWFSAHMHVKFPALVRHADTGKQTRFLALDKVLPRRDFIQLLEIPVRKDGDSRETVSGLNRSPSSTGNSIELDPEWLTILRTDFMDKGPSASSSEAIAETVGILEKEAVCTRINLLKDFEGHRKDGNSQDREKQDTATPVIIQSRNSALMKALGVS